MAKYTYHGTEGTNSVTGKLFHGREFEDGQLPLILEAQWLEKKWLREVPLAPPAKPTKQEVD